MGLILLVEDNEIICDSLKSLVRSVDPSHEIYSTGYAAIGLDYALKNIIDVFLLDIQLLDYPGTQLAEEIRSIDEYKMTPIIFITNDYKLELEAYRNTQCYKFIPKPFKSEEVKKILRTVFDYGIRKPIKDEKIVLRQKGYSISIFQKDIIYVESRNRKIIVVTRHDEIEISKHTQADIMSDLSPDFFQCHKGFIVNTRWILCVDKTNQVIRLNENRGLIPYGPKFKERTEGVWI